MTATYAPPAPDVTEPGRHRIAVLGAGALGRPLGGLLRAAGHTVTFGSRDPESATARTGTPAADPATAVAAADVVVLAVPHAAVPGLLPCLAAPLSGKIVVDATNPVAHDPAGRLTSALPPGRTEGRHLAAALPGARVVRAFTHVPAELVASRGAGQPHRWAMAVAGDDPGAVTVVADLVRDAGFTPVVLGGLDDSAALDPGGALFGHLGTEADLRAAAALPSVPPAMVLAGGDPLAPLFAPLTIGGLTLPNRIVMAPMTRALSPRGVPGPDVAAYYARRARHGVGLIVTEGTVIDHPASASSPDVPRFHGADALDGWAEVVRAVHDEGGRIAPQLWHVGLDPLFASGLRPLPSGAEPVSPSGVLDPADPDRRVGRVLTESGIAEVVASFGRAAARARALGFDAIELHAAHGYLIDQFLWSATNRRTDRYGGDLVARGRFAAEVVAACRAATAPDFPIILRFSQWKVDHYDARLAERPARLAAFLGPLVDAGVDVFHCSTRRFWLPEFPGSPLTLAGWTRRLSGRPAIAVGSIGLDGSEFLTYLDGGGALPGAVDEAVARLGRGEFDLVALGRALLADPEWPEKVRAGRTGELRAFEAADLAGLH